MMDMLMLSCTKATALIDRRTIAGLTVAEKMQLAMHTSMCKYCTRYQKQSELIDKLLNRYIGGRVPNHSSSELEERIINTLIAC